MKDSTGFPEIIIFFIIGISFARCKGLGLDQLGLALVKNRAPTDRIHQTGIFQVGIDAHGGVGVNTRGPPDIPRDSHAVNL